MHTEFSRENLKRDHHEEPGDGMILKCILKKQDGMRQTGFIRVRKEASAGLL
jgi:hypothetical protein